MYICRLFHRDNPFEEIDSRLLDEGVISLGRDPQADWPLRDEDGLLSRLHCRLEVADGRLWLTDESTNGTFLDDGERILRDSPVELAPRQVIRLGPLRLLIDGLPDTGKDLGATTISLAPAPASPARSSGWLGAESATTASCQGALLEAFCEGARLDASALSSEEPEEIMRRAGAIYREMIVGLSDLMAHRARSKGASQLERTTIGASGNNPFKWAPTQKLAQDLLCGETEGFLTDAEAVRASFSDIVEHLAGVETAGEAGAQEVLKQLDPETIDAEAREGASILRSLAAQRWDTFLKRHGAAVDRRRTGSQERGAEAGSRSAAW